MKTGEVCYFKVCKIKGKITKLQTRAIPKTFILRIVSSEPAEPDEYSNDIIFGSNGNKDPSNSHLSQEHE